MRNECEADVKARTGATTRNLRPLGDGVRPPALRAANRRRYVPILRNRTSIFTVALALCVAFGNGPGRAEVPSVADLDATARAAGNRPDIATRIGESVFAVTWPAQVSQISANEMDRHLIVGIRIWGVKFHHRDDAPLLRR